MSNKTRVSSRIRTLCPWFSGLKCSCWLKTQIEKITRLYDLWRCSYRPSLGIRKWHVTVKSIRNSAGLSKRKRAVKIWVLPWIVQTIKGPGVFVVIKEIRNCLTSSVFVYIVNRYYRRCCCQTYGCNHCRPKLLTHINKYICVQGRIHLKATLG